MDCASVAAAPGRRDGTFPSLPGRRRRSPWPPRPASAVPAALATSARERRDGNPTATWRNGSARRR